jgi:hypothetical protein
MLSIKADTEETVGNPQSPKIRKKVPKKVRNGTVLRLSFRCCFDQTLEKMYFLFLLGVSYILLFT